MIVRDATEADLPGIVAIYNAAVPGRLATADTEPVSVASRAAWFADHDPKRRPLWVASVAGEIAGWLSFQSFYGRPAYHATAEVSVYVAPAHHRCGIARGLLERAIETAPRIGLNTLLGFIFGHNEPSLRLFCGFGFERWGLLPRVAVLDGIERDLVIVGLRVPAAGREDEKGRNAMSERQPSNPETTLTPAQERLRALWEDHVRYEFATRDTESTLETMVEDAYVNHIPVLTGGTGRDELREFYSKRFIPQMPPDTEMVPISRTIGSDQVVDEMVFKFTHTIPMDWMLPGIAPTGKRVEVPLVAIVRFRDGKLAHEHIYWDQACVLAQLGLIDARALPVAGAESARKALDPSLPANELMRRSAPRR